MAEQPGKSECRDSRISEVSNKMDKLKLMAFRSVMSPHFIFNILSSIQFFIAKDDKVNAMHYLSTFSKFVRSILDHAADNTIRLSDEIAMLQNYVQLEMTRFEDKFDFTLVVDSAVDTSNIQIPSLLIQPYIENAILHGLYNKNDKGTLAISIRATPNAVIFVIEDNGVGREEGAKLRKQNSPDDCTSASHLAEERLKLINPQCQAMLKVDDLKENGVACGTRVTICVPTVHGPRSTDHGR